MSRKAQASRSARATLSLAIAIGVLLGSRPDALGLTLTVQGSGGPFAGSYRWLVEDDTTHPVSVGVPDTTSLGVSIHASYAPVVMQGSSADLTPLASLDPGRRYFLTVLPDADYTIGGAKIDVAQASATVTVNPWPVPTAQISVFVYEDDTAISGAPELPAERGLPGFQIRIAEILGQQLTDVFGNPLGTTYQMSGPTFVFDVDGNPVVDVVGQGIYTDENGRALIKNVPPGKYNVSASPRDGEDWVQTTSIGGTPQIPVWVKAGEPPIFTQGGPGLLDMHAFIGFVKPFRTLATGGPGTITGHCVNQHTAQPPSALTIPGTDIADCYVGMNIIEAGTERGVLMQAANPTDGTFTLEGIPAGTYQVIVWDKALDNVMGIRQVNVTTGTVAIGNIPMARWVGTFEGSVFRDLNGDGFRGPGEVGMPGQAINLRFRDGSMIQSTETDVLGNYSLSEIPLLGKWTITEIDFARFKVTGATTFTDQGGVAPPVVNTDIGLVLLEGMIVHSDQVNRADWGKTEYGPGADNTFDTADDENGGIAGIVYYASTRAENDPRYAAADDWEPGIPRVQINLYRDANVDGMIDDVDGNTIVEPADVDNYPFGNFPGPDGEDVDHNSNLVFEGGDAIQLGTSDSFDDNLPTGCIGPMPFLDCAETLQTWNQMRIALFDGGWQFVTHVPGGFDTGNPAEPLPLGTYIAEVALPPGYELVKEEDLNVLSGDTFSPTPQLLPPPCVGILHEVSAFLTKDGVTDAPFAGDMRPLCNRKQVTVSRGQNAVADFHLFTQTPKAGRIVGQAVNPFAVQTNPADPSFGSFLTLPWIPISIRDYLGNEITRVYTDEYGAYNALVPSTVNAHVPQPSGYAPNVVVVCANSPATDPQYNPNFDQPCLPLDVMPAKTTYVATALNAITAFRSSLTDVDCELPDGTPVIDQVNGSSGGPWVSPAGDTITITSPGTVMGRDAGFESAQGSGTVTLGGVSLAITSWTNTSIDAVVPPSSATGQLAVTRDNGRSTVTGVTLTVEAAPPTYVTTSIQDAIDGAAVNALVLVPPGTYPENLIISQPVRLQGYGAYSTIIDASAFEANRADWTTKLDALITGMSVDTVPGQRLDLSLEDGAGITILAKDSGPTAFTGSPRARVDGFTLTGATRGGGVFLNGYVHYLQVSNNRFTSNQGMFAGALRAGWQSLVNDTLTGYTRSFNDNLLVHHNHFDRNGSLGDGGAMAFYNGTDAYAVTDNYVCGNYCALNGGGVSHFGNNPDGLIARNLFLFNEAFGEGGGVQMTGGFVPAGGPLGLLGEGTGSVTIDANLMQGNYVGDDGGGISVYGVNGLDVATNPDDPTQWYRVDIINNRIVNNLSSFTAGGIALSESVNVRIVHNTIAHNDSTSVANFGPGNSQVSQPTGAGIVARGNTPQLAAASGLDFANPLLVNNTIWHNRSHVWDQTENGGLGDLVPDPTSPYWDLQVFGQPAGVGMDPRSCVLSEDVSGGDPHGGVVYDGSNVFGDPAFIDDYTNILSITPGPIATVTFTPLAPAGDYAIASAASVAHDAGDGGIAGAFGSELSTDFDGDDRPNAAVDIGADELQEIVPGGAGDTTGPATRNVLATPNPTGGAASVSVTATVDDSGTGGSTIVAAEWWRSTDLTPVPGSGNAMSGAFGSVTVVVSDTVPVPGGGDFTIFVRGQDSNLNWGPAAARLVYETATDPGDIVGPKTDRTRATPNPTEGAGTVTVTAIAYDTVTGGSTIKAAEWWTGADPGAGSGNSIPLPADGTYDEVAENLSATVPTALADFTVFIRSQDFADNWGPATSVLVQVSDPGSGSGGPLFVQCPGDADGDAIVDGSTTVPYAYPSDVRCKHITGGDGFINMADGKRLYIFGFSDVTGVPPDEVMETGILAANFPAPRIVLDEGDQFYLNLSNVGMLIRPDLFDPHSVHWHGFPEAAAIFDGVPEASAAINMGSTLSYYYKVVEPGTYMYHCHVEATEHMQMGMLGNLYVRPRQNRFPDDWCFATGMVTAGPCAGHKHSNPDYNPNRNLDDPLDGDTYAYDDGDGSTYYDVDYPVQIGSLDPEFHDASEGVQPLPFALMTDKYPLLNGRGYPDTMNPSPIVNTADDPKPSQKDHTKIDATLGQKILLRISNLNVTRLYTLATLGIPMKVIGYNARLYRGPSPDGGVTPGKNLYYETNSLTLGGGEAVDVILDTTGITPGTYFLYTSNLNYLTNNEEQFGGMMTEITITP